MSVAAAASANKLLRSVSDRDGGDCHVTVVVSRLRQDPGRAAESPAETRTYGDGVAYGRTRGDGSRRRPDGADVGGRVGVGGGRRRQCRAARQAGPPWFARRRSALTA